jgi:hypothetical protein
MLPAGWGDKNWQNRIAGGMSAGRTHLNSEDA